MKLSILILILFLYSCGINKVIQEQKEYVTGIKLYEGKKSLIVTHDRGGIEKRGLTNEKYPCYITKGEYKLIWTTNLGDFYLSNNENFICETSEIGGLFYKKENAKYYVWTYPKVFLKDSKRQNFREQLQTQKKIDSFNKQSGVRPFVYLKYQIPKEDIIISY